MPCFDGGPTRPEPETPYEAILCGVFTFLENQPLDGTLEAVLENLDYKEMGVTEEEVRVWWEVHKAQDARRRERERKEREREEARQTALSKLTDAEKAALGLD